MKLLGNIIWIVFGGFFVALVYFIIGLLYCITIIGIPSGIQLFKFTRLALWPFGTEVEANFDKHPVLNALWIIFIGVGMAIFSFIVGAIFCITIIGIPFGMQWFKLGRAQLFPFGARMRMR